MTTYPKEIVLPMKEELTDKGFAELLSAKDVEDLLSQKGTSFVVINSVCGCAAGNARPGALLALLQAKKKPDRMFTVFAGYDIEALNKLRENMKPYPPSSPSMALFKDGKIVSFIERHHIEGSAPEMIAEAILAAFEEHC